MGYFGFGAANNTVVDAGSSGQTVSIEYQANATVPSATETTVFSFTNTGAELFIDAVGGEGSARAEWFIYIDTVLKVRRRSGVGDMNIDILKFGKSLPNGSIIDIKVIHYAKTSQSFSAEVRYSR